MSFFEYRPKQGVHNKKSGSVIQSAIIHQKPSVGKITWSRTAIVATLIFWLVYISSTILRQMIDGPHNYQFTMEAFGYAFVVSIFTFSALIYLITRQGAFQRFYKHVRVPRFLLDEYFSNHSPSITVLIPSYSEEPDVIRKTIFSAAIQEYPSLRIVLLIDDDPFPKTERAYKRLQATHELIEQIKANFSQPQTHFKNALDLFDKRTAQKKSVAKEVIEELSSEYSWAAYWLYKTANNEQVEDHVDYFFVNRVIRDLARELDQVAEALGQSASEDARLSRGQVLQLYKRLVNIFSFELDLFERKKYTSLSHEANKAMNLNAYIGLMGGSYKEESSPKGLILIPSDKKSAPSKNTITIPDSEFILTLDADSILLRDYCMRLVYFLEQPDNQRVAVTQTPYSSFPGASSSLERLSGATTDIQHILHQGMSFYGATFWVGANAMIRKKALEEIVLKEWVGGYEIRRYIQDHTVIEDTESSIDLISRGWKLINYPERLSYSATPPDFGALIVQRRRWANGGLLILPKLISHIRGHKNKTELVSYSEIMVRLNYLASIAWSTFGLIFLLAYPYDGRLLSPLVLLSALPYYMAMAFDLKYCGYGYFDIFRIYGFNLILLPVNLAGIIKSLEQALTGRKIPFARTPKVKNRTSAGLLYILAPVFIVAFSLFTMWRNVNQQNWANAAVAGFNAVAALYAIVIFIGVKNFFIDLFIGLTDWLYVENKAKNTQIRGESAPISDWKTVLYHGEAFGGVSVNSLNELIAEIPNPLERQTPA